MFEIDNSVPVPEHRSKYPFADMKPGDSFVAPGVSAGAGKCRAYDAAKYYARRHGVKFIGRKAGPGKVRIWRVE